MKKCYVFKGAGGYLAWYFGYAKYLQEYVNLTNASFAGTSAGSIVAAFLAYDVPMGEVWKDWLMRIINDGVAFPSTTFRPIVKRYALNLLRERKMQKQRLYIALTDSNLNRVSKNKFKTAEDVVDCVLASCHVPWVLDGNMCGVYTECKYMDGSICNTFGDKQLYTPCGEKCMYIRVETPYENYKQIASLYRFQDRSFHEHNYVDGYNYAKKLYSNYVRPNSVHADQSTVSL
jgi:hypothetical protein